LQSPSELRTKSAQPQLSRVRLMELLAAYRVSPIQATPEELRAELERG
jgi:hypothetical protein